MLLEGTADVAPSETHPVPEESADAYHSLFRKISATAMQGQEQDWATRLISLIGILIFAALVAGCVWFCWYAWTYDPDAVARRAEWREYSKRWEREPPSQR